MKTLRVDGGAIANDFPARFQADVPAVPVQCARQIETTAIGAAYLAGLAVGYWKNREEIARHRASSRDFPRS